MGWQPIETAPRDGTWLLLHSPHNEPPVSVGCYELDDYASWIMMEADFAPSYITPTHWMPLPSAPTTPGGAA